MAKIEGNHAAARYAAVQKEYQKQQNVRKDTPADKAGYRVWQPEYRNDVTARHYEIASWLQEMGTLQETGAADGTVPQDGQITNVADAPVKKQFSNQTHTAGAPNLTRTTAAQEKQDDTILTEEEAAAAETAAEKEEAEKEKMPWESDEEMSKEETELERLQKMLERYKEQREEKKESTKKPLKYKYSRVSTAIRGAKTVMQASNALVKANSSLSQLKRQAASGQYNESEVAMAQTHARKMVRTARAKLRNIKAEHNQKNNNTLAKDHASAKMGTVVKKVQAQQKLDAIQQKDREMLKLTKLIQRKEAAFKNKHRRKENWDLMEADMEYLRRRVEYLKNQDDQSLTGENSEFIMSTNETNVFTSADQSGILEGVAAMDAIDPAAAVETAVEAVTKGDML